MKIRNDYIKKLSFEWEDLGHFSIHSKEEKTVSDEMGNRLLLNKWIKEVKKDTQIPIQTNEIKIKKKGRRKKSN